MSIRRAIVGTEGSVRASARRSGADVDSPRIDRAEQLAGAIAQTARPDCLAPNGGGSLLSIPIIAFMAANGKCK